MVVQLSLLSWAHEYRSPAQVLVHIFAEHHAKELGNFPAYSDIFGTLRCIKEQTCSFPWESKFKAIESVLASELRPSDWADDLRTISDRMLEVLMDALPVVQRWPGEHSIDIRTGFGGPSTIIIWAHDLLGLTVSIVYNERHCKFGGGMPNLTVDCATAWGIQERIALLNRTKDVDFECLPEDLYSRSLKPAERHPLYGFGSRHWVSNFPHETAGEFARKVTSVALDWAAKNRTSGQSINAIFSPSDARILEMSRVICPEYPQIGYEAKHEYLEATCEDPRALPIIKLILTLTAITNVQDCLELPLALRGIVDVGREPWYFNHYNAFGCLSQFMLGDNDTSIRVAAVVSSGGWSLVLSSVALKDSQSLEPHMAVIRGVPARNGERKSFIVDRERHWTRGYLKSWPYQIIGRSGDTTAIRPFVRGSTKRKYMIGVVENAFIVQIRLQFEALDGPSKGHIANSTLGFRAMQNAYWSSYRLPPCDCLNIFPPGQEIQVPPKTWVFQGFPQSLGGGEDRDDEL